MPRPRKRGRPRTGSKPVVPVRLAAKQVKKIDKLAELEGVDRSTVMRELIDIGLASPQVTLLMRRPGAQGRTVVGRIIRVVAANERVKVTQSAVRRAPSVETEVNALRADFESWVAATKETPGSWWPDWAQWVTAQAPEKVSARKPGEGRLKAIGDAPGDYVRAKA
jgi:Ribbon-helix-helix protein, copG family